MADTTHIDEQKISAYLDKELSLSEAEFVEKQLESDKDAVNLYKNFNNIKVLFNKIKETEEKQDFPSELFWQDLKSKISEEDTPKKATVELDVEEFKKAIGKTGEITVKHTASSHVLTALIGATAGIAASIAIFMFLVLPSVKTGGTAKNNIAQKKVPPVVIPHVPAPSNNVKTVSSHDVKSQDNNQNNNSAVPNPTVEAIVKSNDSCIIESMSTKDDIIPTVFKIPDDDDTMITVIWLPFDDSEDYI